MTNTPTPQGAPIEREIVLPKLDQPLSLIHPQSLQKLIKEYARTAILADREAGRSAPVAWMIASITVGHVFYEGASRPEGASERAIPLYAGSAPVAPLVSMDYPDYLRRDEWDASVERKQRELEQRVYRADAPVGRQAESDQRWKALADVGPEAKGRGFLVNGWHVPVNLVTVYEQPVSATHAPSSAVAASPDVAKMVEEAKRHTNRAVNLKDKPDGDYAWERALDLIDALGAAATQASAASQVAPATALLTAGAMREPLTEQAEELAWQQHGRKAGWLAADGSLAEGADASKAQIAYFNFKAGMQFAHGIPARSQPATGATE